MSMQKGIRMLKGRMSVTEEEKRLMLAKLAEIRKRKASEKK